MDLLVTGLLRRSIGLSIVTGAMQPHKWLVLAALKVAEVGGVLWDGRLNAALPISSAQSYATGRCATVQFPAVVQACHFHATVLAYELTASSGNTYIIRCTVEKAVGTVQGLTAGDAAPGAIGAKQQELYKAMAAGCGPDSTVLVSQRWPHALRLLQVMPPCLCAGQVLMRARAHRTPFS